MPAILCVMPHPDDESFGPAGTIAKYAAQGTPVDLLTLTKGQVGTRPEPLDSPEQLGLLREYETRAAAKVLGVRTVTFLDYMDGELDKAEPEVLAIQVGREIERSGAAAVIGFGPYGLTRHGDHVAAHRATLAGVKRSARPVRLFYIAVEGAWATQMNLDGVETQPTHRIDMSGFFETKLAALACHSSQQDAREFFLMLSQGHQREELFHQALPPYDGEGPAHDLFG